MRGPERVCVCVCLGMACWRARRCGPSSRNLSVVLAAALCAGVGGWVRACLRADGWVVGGEGWGGRGRGVRWGVVWGGWGAAGKNPLQLFVRVRLASSFALMWRGAAGKNPLEPLLVKLAKEFSDSQDLSERLQAMYQAR